jgi:DNA repair protein RadC
MPDSGFSANLIKWGDVTMSRTRINFYSIKQVKEKGGLYEAPAEMLREWIVRSPEDCYQAAKILLSLHDCANEHFCIFSLSTKNKIIGVHTLFQGSLNASIVHPREVFQAALLNNAASIVCFHNHPSTDPTPSSEDISVTKRLLEAGKILGIDVLDHLIIGDEFGNYVSLKEKGYL